MGWLYTMIARDNVTEMYNVSPKAVATTLEELNAEEAEIYTATVILVSILSAIGIFGNLHILVIYFWKMRSSNPRVFILSLAILDIITCTTGMPFVIINSKRPFTFNDTAACKVLSTLSYFTSVSSGFILIMIAIDRHRKVCRPLAKQITRRTAKIMCLISMLLAALVSWPAPILYGISPIETKNPNITGTECTFLSDFKDSAYLLVFNGVLLLTSITVFIILVVLYSLARRTIMTHDEFRSTFENTNTRNSVTHSPLKTSCSLDNFDSTPNPLNFSRFGRNMSLDLTGRSLSSSMFTLPYDTTSFTNSPVVLNRHKQRLSSSCSASLPDIAEETPHNNERKEEKYSKRLSKSLEDLYTKRIKRSDVSDELDSSSRRKSLDSILKFVAEQTKKAPRLFRRTKRMTIMFIWITIVFFVSFVTHQVLRVAAFVIPDLLDRLSFEGKVAYNFFLWCIFVNNMSNWIIYGYWDKKFRTETKRFYRSLLCCCRNKP